MNKFKSKNGYKPTEEEKFMNDKMKAYFKEKLLYMKDNLSSRDKAKEEAIVNELQSLKESDPNDRASKEEATALDLKKKERISTLLARVEVALVKIESGEFGYCEETGNQISVLRLDIMPTTLYTIDALKELEKANGNKPL